MKKNKLEKLVNITTILLVGALGIAGFMVMNHTAESNKVTADIAKIQSEHKSDVLKEMRLFTVELRNLQKDMDTIIEKLKEIEREDESRRFSKTKRYTVE